MYAALPLALRHTVCKAKNRSAKKEKMHVGIASRRARAKYFILNVDKGTSKW